MRGAIREAGLHHDAARIAVHMAPAIDARHRSSVRRLGVPLLAATRLARDRRRVDRGRAGRWTPLSHPDVAGDGDAPRGRVPARRRTSSPRRPARGGVAGATARRSRRGRRGRARGLRGCRRGRPGGAIDPGVAAQVASRPSGATSRSSRRWRTGCAAKGNGTAAERSASTSSGQPPTARRCPTRLAAPGRTRSGNGTDQGSGTGGGSGSGGAGANGGGGPEETRPRERRRRSGRRRRRRAARHRTRRRRRADRATPKRPHRSPGIPALRTTPTSRSTPRADRIDPALPST